MNHSQYSVLQPGSGEKGQGLGEGKRKEVNHAQISATLVGQPHPTSSYRSITKDTKCFICQKTGHWNKECPNSNKPLQEPYQEPGAKRQATGQHSIPQAKGPLVLSPQLPCRWQLRTEAACPSWSPQGGHYWTGPLREDITRAHMDLAGRTVTFLLDSGVTYSVFTSFSRPFSSQSYTVLQVTRKPTTRNFHSSFGLPLGWVLLYTFFFHSHGVSNPFTPKEPPKQQDHTTYSCRGA